MTRLGLALCRDAARIIRLREAARRELRYFISATLRSPPTSTGRHVATVISARLAAASPGPALRATPAALQSKCARHLE